MNENIALRSNASQYFHEYQIIYNKMIGGEASEPIILLNISIMRSMIWNITLAKPKFILAKQEFGSSTLWNVKIIGERSPAEGRWAWTYNFTFS